MQFFTVAAVSIAKVFQYTYSFALLFMIVFGRKMKYIADPVPPPVRPPNLLPQIRDVDLSSANIEISEAMMRKAAELVGGNNGYKKLLLKADVFKEAGLDPVFLTDSNQQLFRVVVREYMETPWMLN